MAKEFFYGGQAVIEGVMMRGAHKAAIAVRNPSGEIVVHEQPLNAHLYRGRIPKTPFVRGLVGLWDALGLGTRALMWSADVAVSEEEEEISFNGPIGFATLAISLIFGIGLFFVVPTVGASVVGNWLNLSGADAATSAEATQWGHFLINVIEGVIRLALLVGYIWLIGRIPDVKRLFGYHGAEHKTINAYEAGAELIPEVVAQYPIEHPRCGTAFLLTVAVVSVLVFSLLGRPPMLLLIASRVLLIPVIAGIAYEIIRFTARNLHNPIVRAIIIPNLALQHLTTRDPDLTMIEVAITAFKRVLVSEQILREEDAPLPVASEPAAQPAGQPVAGD
ncbi:MAG: DUF1385 domain-containing protein [Anaerolineae bacterium]|nr:DUF1385 domain-containing protein [Anaerolineae bacterium]